MLRLMHLALTNPERRKSYKRTCLTAQDKHRGQKQVALANQM